MYAALITGSIRPDQVDQAIGIYQERIVPMVRAWSGFRGLYVLIDRASGRGLISVLYETEEDARRVETSGQFQQAAAAFGEMLAAPPTREVREVIYHDQRGPARYARVTEAALEPDQVARVGDDTSMPEAAAQQPGYAGFLVTVDRAGGKLTGMSFWESQQALEASEQGYYQRTIAESAGRFAGQPTRSIYEVAVQA